MHEVEMMENLLKAAVNRAEEEGAQHIRLIHMRVGEVSGIVPDSLQLAFDIAKVGTMAEDGKLKIEYLPARCYCSKCHLEFQPLNHLYQCPQCNQLGCEVRQGQEFELAFLEVS